MALRWIGVAKKNRMRQQHRLVSRETLQQPPPIHLPALAENQVDHIRAVKAIAVLHEGFGPQRLFRRDQASGVAENLSFHGMSEPSIIDGAEPIAGVVEQIDERLAAQGLGDPEGIKELGAIA